MYSENFGTPLSAWARIFGVIALTIAVSASTAPQAISEEAKAHTETMSSEFARMVRYVELDSARDVLMYHQTSTILATYGEYNTYLKSDGSQSNGTDLSRFRNRVAEQVPAALSDFRREMARDKSIPSEDADLVNTAEQLLSEMITAADEIIDLCATDQPYEASLVYRDKSVPLNSELMRILYTLRSGSIDEFKKAALKAKYQ